jgi:hypothetical protein
MHQTFWKGETRDKEKARADRRFEKARQLARYEAFKHFGGCCWKCGVPLKLKVSEARHEFEIAHAHELDARSLCKQFSDPTNPRCIVILCFRCHQEATNGAPRLYIVAQNPTAGTFGPLTHYYGRRVDAQRDTATT